jgi:putative transposase
MERNIYPTDLTDEQWKLVKPLIPPGEPGGRPRGVDMREVVNGILYLNRNGCTWRSMPHEFPKWITVYYYFRRFQKDGTWDTIHEKLRDKVRKKAGRQKSPSAAIIDSQTVKTTEKKGSAAGTTRARRSAAASGTSSSIQWGSS